MTMMEEGLRVRDDGMLDCSDPEVATMVVETLASPPRIEIFHSLGHGPRTVADLADELGRAPDSLYYHLRLMEEAGIVRQDGCVGRGRKRAAVFRRLVPGGMHGLHLGDDGFVAGICAFARAMMRVTEQNIRDARHLPDLEEVEEAGGFVACRSTSRLTPEEAERVHELIGEAYEIFERGRTRTEGRRVALTCALVPLEDANGRRPGA